MTNDVGKSKSADILLVEDNPGDVRLTKEAFKEDNIANTLHVVTDGVEALDFLYGRDDVSVRRLSRDHRRDGRHHGR